MEKTQVDAIVQAILEPDPRVQEELRIKRAKQAADLARKRHVLGFSLVGAGIGVALTYFNGYPLTEGYIYGNFAGCAVGWLVTHRAVT